MFIETKSNIKIVGLMAADNRLSIYPMVLGPSATAHAFEDKFIEISVSTVLFIFTRPHTCFHDSM